MVHGIAARSMPLWFLVGGGVGVRTSSDVVAGNVVYFGQSGESAQKLLQIR